MDKTRLELYTTLRQPEVREVEREDGKKCKNFRGYAIVFNEGSVLMYDKKEKLIFREYVKPEAIEQEMLDNTDIVCTAFHNREKLLARHHSDNTGTMKLEKDDTGVLVEFEFDDNNPLHCEIASAVSRGDMPGMSFSFYDDDYTFSDEKGSDGIYERTINSIESIFEVTVASQPAYPSTTAACREAWLNEVHREEKQDDEDLEKAQREQEYLLRKREREAEALRLRNHFIY